METSSKRNDDNKIELTVVLSADEVKKGIDAAYKEAGKVRIPGFRPGKAPRLVLDNHYGGKGYFQAQATDELVKSTFALAVDGEGYVPLDSPDFEELDLVEEGEDYSYTMTFTVRPVLELSSVEPVQIELPSGEPTPEEIDEQIVTMLQYYSTFEEITDRPAQDGDFVFLEMEVTVNGQRIDEISGQNVPYELGSGALPPSFDKKLLGTEIGEKREFTFSFSVDDADEADENEENVPHASLTLKQIRIKILPELTDAWVKEIMEFESADEFKSRLAESLRQQKQAELPPLKERLVAEELASRLQGEPTEILITQTEQSIYRDFFTTLQQQNLSFDNFLINANITADAFREDIKRQATEAAAQALALDALARHLALEVTEEELREEFAKSGAPDPDDLYKQWADNGRISEVREGILRMKAAQHLGETAEVFEPGKKPTGAKGKSTKTAEKAASKKSTAKKTAAEKTDDKKVTAEDEKAAPKEAKATAKKPSEKKTATKAKSAAEKADNKG